MGGRVPAARAAVAWVILLTAVPVDRVAAADLTVLGCNEQNPGEIGVRELVGDVGDTLGVSVVVNTTAALDAFALDLAFPTHLLTYVRTDPGTLLAGGWGFFDGRYVAADGVIRIGGLDPTPIPAGTMGQLAIVFFVVVSTGSDSFGTLNYVDDIVGYTPCEQVHPPTAVSPTTWTRVKAEYR